MTRHWDISFSWSPVYFFKTPYFTWRRVKSSRGFLLDFAWLWGSIHVKTYDFGPPLPQKPKKVCEKGCPYPRDAGECLRKQGVPGAGGSFGDWCECKCHLEAS